MAVRNIIAVDLGATSGRVMLAVWDGAAQQISLREVHRFANGFVKQIVGTWTASSRKSLPASVNWIATAQF